MYTVYGLVDPRNNSICYIGMTSNHPAVRLRQHFKDASSDSTSLKNWWLNELRELGSEPSIVCLEHTSDAKTASEKEKEWIERAVRMKWPLTNDVAYGKAIRRVVARKLPKARRRKRSFNVPLSAAEVKAAIFAHLDANPDATQAEIRATLGSSRAWTNACWHEWHNQDADAEVD